MWRGGVPGRRNLGLPPGLTLGGREPEAVMSAQKKTPNPRGSERRGDPAHHQENASEHARDQGIVRDSRGQEQPRDKGRAQQSSGEDAQRQAARDQPLSPGEPAGGE